METGSIRLITLRRTVNDLKTSVEFWERRGFFVVETKSTDFQVSTYMRTSEVDNFRLCLTEYLVIDYEPDTSIELETDQWDGSCLQEDPDGLAVFIAETFYSNY